MTWEEFIRLWMIMSVGLRLNFEWVKLFFIKSDDFDDFN